MSEISDQKNDSAAVAQEAYPSEDSQQAIAAKPQIHIGPDWPQVTERVGPNRGETEILTGQIRLRWLTPFARARRGEPYELWNPELLKMEVHDKPLALRPVVNDLAARLGCGVDFVYQLVDKLVNFPGGPQNAQASDMLKTPQGGGEGTSRLGHAKEQALEQAIWDVRVTRGMKTGRKAMKEIRDSLEESPAFAGMALPGADTIAKRWNSEKILTALADPYERDHLNRMCGDPDKIVGLNSVLCIDCATMSNEEQEVRALDEHDRDLGPVTCIWGINAATRGVWTVCGFPGAQNGFLVGHAIRQALIDKQPLLKECGLENEIWPFHGRPGQIQHDHGSEFINEHIERALRERDIAFPSIDHSPAKTPHFRGRSERFHQTAQWLFAEFLKSGQAKQVIRTVEGKPNAIGIRLSDLNKALVTWVVLDWHKRPLKALGGDSPLARWEKYVQGRNGLPLSGIQLPLEDSNELRWQFLWRETRTVNHIGIQFLNRNYRSFDLNALLQPNSRSSGKRIEFRFNPYLMGQIFVKVPGECGDEIVSIPWVPIDDRFRPTADLAARSQNPTMWEWKLLYQDLKNGNSAKPTPALMEDLQRHREEQEKLCRGRRGRGRQKQTAVAHRAMRGFAANALPITTSKKPEPTATLEQFMPDRRNVVSGITMSPYYLPVGDAGHEEY